jgi:hypothetical protein
MATLKVQTTAYAAIEKGLNNAEVLAVVLKRHPNAHTTLGCISYYRSKLNSTRADSQKLPQHISAQADKPLATPIALQTRLLKAVEKLAKLEQEIYELTEATHQAEAETEAA